MNTKGIVAWATAAVAVAGTCTAAINAWSKASETAEVTQQEFTRQVEANKAFVDAVEFRFRVIDMRIKGCEDRFLNPMLGRPRALKAYDALTRAPLPRAPTPQQPPE